MRSRVLWILIGILAILEYPVSAQRLFVGLETSPSQPTKSTDLSGFPDVTWTNHFVLDVSGAAATPDGRLYLCNGAFTTHLYESMLTGPPEELCTTGVDLAALAYGRNTLWGYSNYASPKGIYAIDPETGAATLVLDVYTGTGYRFFGLDYNPVDDMLYGYTEYGVTGLYRIDIDTGEMTWIASPIPAANSQGRALAVGNHTVYIAATRGDEDIPYYAYDLSQGIGGTWVGFTNPYPNHHSTGGATWIPDPAAGVDPGAQSMPRLLFGTPYPNPMTTSTALAYELPVGGRVCIDVCDATGRRIAELLNGELPAGPHHIQWRGVEQNGKRAPSGRYYMRLRTAGQTYGRTVLLVP